MTRDFDHSRRCWAMNVAEAVHELEREQRAGAMWPVAVCCGYRHGPGQSCPVVRVLESGASALDSAAGVPTAILYGGPLALGSRLGDTAKMERRRVRGQERAAAVMRGVRSRGRDRSQERCGFCGRRGHNRRTCPGFGT